ncbi:MAG TPA: hypothetical protein VKU01_23720 [Bryobacteraceae bacterium]|nr:hypothetical protein [Bryobacteraceae bacterium]
MIKKAAIAISVFTLAIASAANSYRINLYQPTSVNGTEFKPGECKVEVKDNQVILKQGKTSAEASVKVENSKDKFNITTVGYTNGNQIQEIRLGNTNTKLVFSSEPEGEPRASH